MPKTKRSIGWRQLEQAGFKVEKGYRRKFYVATAPDGFRGVVLRQSPNKWHWFEMPGGCASGCNAATCTRGGLGDAIDTDGALRVYRRLLRDAPDCLLQECTGLYYAACEANQ